MHEPVYLRIASLRAGAVAVPGRVLLPPSPRGVPAVKKSILSDARLWRLKRTFTRLTLVLIVVAIAIWFGWLVADTLYDLTSQE